MDHQDWTPVVLNPVKPKAKVVPRPPDETIQSRKIESEDYVPPKVSLSLQRKIQDARQNKGWSQKDLAARVNVKPAIINGYESGNIVPDHKMLQKISRALGTPLSLKN